MDGCDVRGLGDPDAAGDGVHGRRYAIEPRVPAPVALGPDSVQAIRVRDDVDVERAMPPVAAVDPDDSVVAGRRHAGGDGVRFAGTAARLTGDDQADVLG